MLPGAVHSWVSSRKTLGGGSENGPYRNGCRRQSWTEPALGSWGSGRCVQEWLWEL
jgi:hypothetical protein